jgi:hypothetical protein
MNRLLVVGAIGAILAGGLLSACASTSSQTNRDLGYSGHPTRIFIVSNLGKLGDSFSDELQKRMVAGIESCGGQAAFDRVSETELDQTARNNQIKDFKADAVLSMQLTSWETMDGQITSANIDSKLWDVTTKKAVWRANSKMHMGELTPASTKADSLYKELVPKLRADGMIPSCASSAALLPRQ